MYSLSTRFNVVLYNMMAGMVAMGFLNYLSGFYGTHIIKDTHFEMTNMNMFINDKYYNEHVSEFQFDLKADISGLFNWNTNVIFFSVVCEFEHEAGKRNAIVVWDQRILREMTEFYKLDLKDEWIEYYFTDQHKSLKGKDVKVYVRWEQMTVIGPYYSGKMEVGSFTMPSDFKNASKKRSYKPGPSDRVENY